MLASTATSTVVPDAFPSFNMILNLCVSAVPSVMFVTLAD